MILFLSDGRLTAVAAGKQRPSVQRNRELDDVTHRATGGHGAVTNWHGKERENSIYCDETSRSFITCEKIRNSRAHFVFRFGFFFTKPRISSQELIKQLQYENDALQSKIISVEQTELQEVGAKGGLLFKSLGGGVPLVHRNSYPTLDHDQLDFAILAIIVHHTLTRTASCNFSFYFRTPGKQLRLFSTKLFIHWSFFRQIYPIHTLHSGMGMSSSLTSCF